MGQEKNHVGDSKQTTLNSGREFQTHGEYQAGGSAFATIPSPKLVASLPAVPIPGQTPSKAMTSSSSSSVQESETKKRDWNTNKLGLRIASDALAAGTAAVLIAPIITAIDKGIIENASGRNTLKESLKSSAKQILTRPVTFFGGVGFRLVFALYTGTYLTANLVDTLSSTLNPSTPITSTTAGTTKFLATSTSNLALCLYKDSRFTQLFGSAVTTTPRPVPIPTYALFTIRDCLTIFASFNLPAILSPHLESRLSSEAKRFVSAASVAQFVTPAAVQIFSTPLHLLGLDLYNRSNVGARDRGARVVRDWAKSAVARMGRIVPAFGVGGVVNARVRRGLLGRLE